MSSLERFKKGSSKWCRLLKACWYVSFVSAMACALSTGVFNSILGVTRPSGIW